MDHTCCDAKAGVEVVNGRKSCGIWMKGDPIRRREPNGRDEDDKGGVEPVNLLVPVAPRKRHVLDMRLVDVSSPTTEWLVVGCAIRTHLFLASHGHGLPK